MKSIHRMTQAELAAYVQSHLRSKGISVVLSGGAAVAIYSENKYVSPDIDFVDVSFIARNKLKAAMAEIGFGEKNRYFIHPDTKFIIEFPRGPLAIDEEPVRQVNEIRYSTGTLRIISATDCVKDRLAAFYFWNDQQSLAQAILVASSTRIHIAEIKRWSQATGKLKEFEIFRKKRSAKSR